LLATDLDHLLASRRGRALRLTLAPGCKVHHACGQPHRFLALLPGEGGTERTVGTADQALVLPPLVAGRSWLLVLPCAEAPAWVVGVEMVESAEVVGVAAARQGGRGA
jgi:hypothetical protein